MVRPLVLGDLGSIAHLARELREMKILSEAALKQLIANCQLDVVYSATRLIKSHLGGHEVKKEQNFTRHPKLS